MKIINSITADYKQKFKFLTETGEQVQFRMYYYITQQSWFFDFTYKDYTCNCQRIALSPNALRHLKNIIPFGVAFMSDDKVEPILIDDFESGRVKMYILNREEVIRAEENIYGI